MKTFVYGLLRKIPKKKCRKCRNTFDRYLYGRGQGNGYPSICPDCMKSKVRKT